MNLDDIVNCKKVNLEEDINQVVLVNAGLIRENKLPLKVLGNGDIEKAIKIEAHKFSASAAKKISDAGGTTSIIGS